MPRFSLTQETSSNSNTGGLFQILMAAGRQCRLLACLLRLDSEATNQDIGRFVIDRISGLGATNWDTQVPFELDQYGAASAISDTTKSVENTCNGQIGTQVDIAMFELSEGWNDLEKWDIRSGAAQGFQVRRATAPSGARVVTGMLLWEE